MTLIQGDSTTVEIDGHFDIVIDDGAHDCVSQRKTFQNLIGCADWYFIEDVWPIGLMTKRERQHPWLQKPGYSAVDYYWLLDALKTYDKTFHDLRDRYFADTFVIEVRP